MNSLTKGSPSAMKTERPTLSTTANEMHKGGWAMQLGRRRHAVARVDADIEHLSTGLADDNKGGR
jgi:hypothetical protein